MKKIILAFILAAGAAVIATLAGCADDAKGPSGTENSSSENSVPQNSSVENTDSSSVVSESDGESSENSDDKRETEDSSSEGESENSDPNVNDGICLSTCPVPAWGLNDSEDGNLFKVASEYDTYRVLQETEFENGAVKEIRIDVYVISEDFDMVAFSNEWGVVPVWNSSCYEGIAHIPEKYADMTVEEIKLDLAKPLLKKYGSATYDGFPEIVMVDPSIAPDPAFDF